jgi:exoribonuclease-2
MESGKIVEYIDRQKIVCAVVLEVKNQRLRLLSEANREVNLSAGRLFHLGRNGLDISAGRLRLVEQLKEIAQRRRDLVDRIDIRELWEVLNTEQEWIDLPTMTAFCFPNSPSGDHESAVVRAFFKNRLFFKFKSDGFFPNTAEQVAETLCREQEVERRNRFVGEAAEWLKKALGQPGQPVPADKAQVVEILKSVGLFDKESEHFELGKAILDQAGIGLGDPVFQALVRLGVWSADENLDLIRLEAPVDFPEAVVQQVAAAARAAEQACLGNGGRRDLTELSLMTIDGQSTLDFDDALSVSETADGYELGVHIADVGSFIRKGALLDEEALARGSSIYMPDMRIPMIPPRMAEDLCSLKAGEIRPAISLMARLSPMAEVLAYEIFPSRIRVARQLTYFEVNSMADEDPDIRRLHAIATRFREKRLSQGALQINLPEINVWLDPTGKLAVTRTNRESPGRLLVSEIMILANWLMARFLAGHGIPAIFRSQPAPRERLIKEDGGTLFQNWMQRKSLSRFALSPAPEHHSGLGLEAYVTATSPIRKYFDLATQRQMRGILGLEPAAGAEEITRLVQLLELPMSRVANLQFRRNRYWLLKYLEGRTGQREEALVLVKRRNGYLVLLTEYMIECSLTQSGSVNLKPEDLVQVTLQHVDARKDQLVVFLS